MTKEQAQLWEEMKKLCADRHTIIMARQYPPLRMTSSRTPSYDAIIIDYIDVLPKEKK